jgi:hypothetical protein
MLVPLDVKYMDDARSVSSKWGKQGRCLAANEAGTLKEWPEGGLELLPKRFRLAQVTPNY